jgi:DNA replication protein DnaC
VIPERYKAANYNQLIGADRQIGRARRYVEEDHLTHAWLLIQGLSGTGKTHLAAVAAGHFASLYVAKVGWINAGDMASEVLDLSFKGGVTSYLSQYFEPYLLILDDLGIEGSQESVRLAVYRLLNTRWERRLRTIITTNMSMADLATKHGQQVVDRILRTGMFTRFTQDSFYWRTLTGATTSAGSPDQNPRLAQAGDPSRTETTTQEDPA